MNVVWFKRDLRVEDHEALSMAAARGAVVPIFIVEPELWASHDMSGRQWEFVRETLSELRGSLAQQGQALIIRVGDAVQVFESLRQQYKSLTLFSHQETGNAWTYARDLRVLAWAKQHGIEWNEPRQSGIIRRIKSRDGWAREWNRFMSQDQAHVPQLSPLTGESLGALPTSTDLGLRSDPCPGRQRGGRATALETLESFLLERGRPYPTAMSGPIGGARHCSRLSPYFAWGAVSMREVTQRTRLRQAELRSAKDKTGWLRALAAFSKRLHWRGHFMQKLEDEPSIEYRNFHSAYDGMRVNDRDRFDAWASGHTGWPFVDACMRSLIHTGWINFRMRAMLTAVASYHLWMDWRMPGEHLARLFVDYEAGIHWSQIQMQSGTTGINTVRMYNPIKQGHDQDPAGIFVRQWIPELKDVPDEFVHEPWTWDGASSLLGKGYPYPVVDHLESAKEARGRIWSVRKGTEYRVEANAIVEKHGSRKRPSKRSSKKTSAKQLTLAVEKDME